MYSKINSLVLGLALLSSQVLATPGASSFANFKPTDIIERDVAIIGGGSAGTYSAINLKDEGKSVVVIEKKGRLGGHTETYIDPATGTTFDIGVVIFHNISVVRDYFQRLNVTLSPFIPTATQNENYDLRSGEKVNVTTYSQEEVGAALAGYTQQLLKYPELDEGMFLPNPVPEDLVMPFGEFVKKYNIEAVIPTMYQFNPGLGDILTVPTVENMRVFGLSLVQQLQTGFLTTPNQNNSELYTNAQAELLASSSLLLNSEVEAANRPNNGNKRIELVVCTPSGKKLIRAKRLLITIPPRTEFLKPFDLNKTEKDVFGKLINAGYYTSVVNNSGIPDDLTISNKFQDTPYNLPELPATYNIQNTRAPGLHIAYYGTSRSAKIYTMTDEEVKADIIAGIKTLQAENPDVFEQTEPEFVEFSSHSPFYLQARPEDTKKGFYEKLYALQGGRNTFWTGATFVAQDSSMIWKFTEKYVLPELVAGL